MVRRSASVAVLVAVLGAGCARRAPAPPPNVVLVTLDTVRADHLSAYGYGVRTSPRLEALAREATLYRRAYSAAPWTIPSHASLFTGKFPFEHGAHSFPVDRPDVSNVYPLDAAHLTLAEALRAGGYHTAAFVANAGYLAPRWGLNQGFDTYLARQVYAAELNKPVRRFLRREAREPFFLFVNYMDAHRPYNSAPRPGLLPRPVVPPDDGRLLVELYKRVMPAAAAPPPELVQQVVDQYDTALANLDEELGRLIDRLRELGMYERTLIVITSDHGEYFGEHALVEHSKDVYQPALHVPLVIKAPGQQEGREEWGPVSSVDLPRQVLAHLPRESFGERERDFPYAPGNHPLLAENYYTRAKDLVGQPWSARFRRVRAALFEGPFKLIRSSDGRHELYELERDPREARDLFAADVVTARRLLGALERFERGRPRFRHGPPPSLAAPSAEERETLRALGYID
jgi:arylsulfatase A-like enzyme